MAPALSFSYDAGHRDSASHLAEDCPLTACREDNAPDGHLDLLSGLRSSPKSVPCSYLYDAYGSELYDQVRILPYLIICIVVSLCVQIHLPPYVQIHPACSHVWP